MAAGTGSLKLVSDNVERGSDIALMINVPLSASATTSATTVETVLEAVGAIVKDDGTRSEDPHDDTA